MQQAFFFCRQYICWKNSNLDAKEELQTVLSHVLGCVTSDIAHPLWASDVFSERKRYSSFPYRGESICESYRNAKHTGMPIPFSFGLCLREIRESGRPCWLQEIVTTEKMKIVPSDVWNLIKRTRVFDPDLLFYQLCCHSLDIPLPRATC